MKTFDVEDLDQRAISIARQCRDPQFKPEEIAKKSSAAACFAEWLQNVADAADALEKERLGMPAELKAPRTAEEI